PIPPVFAGPALAADRPVAVEGVPRDRGRGPPAIIDGAAEPLVDEGAPCVAAAAGGPVVGERAAGQGQGRLRVAKGDVLDGAADAAAQDRQAAAAGVVTAAARLVVVERAVGDGCRPNDAQRPAGADADDALAGGVAVVVGAADGPVVRKRATTHD